MYKHLIVASVVSLFVVGSANANLLTNGSFDEFDAVNNPLVNNPTGIKFSTPLADVGTSGNSSWDVYTTLPGGWWSTGRGIEVQYDNTVVPAHSPNFYVELDSHAEAGLPNTTPANSSMYQNFQVDTEAEYFVSLWYRPRTDNVGDNGINITLLDDLALPATAIATLDGISSEISDWTYYSFSLGALTPDTYRIGFEAFGTENTLGGFLDDVAVAAVPEPATMLLLGTGLVGLIGARFRRKK